MNSDQRDLVSRLFTLATEILEDSHEPAMRGQSLRLRAAEYRKHGELLEQVAEDLKSVARAVAAALR